MSSGLRDARVAAAIACLLAPAAGALDSDADGVDDARDNCTLAANADQRDTDADRYGNACDADLTNDLVVNFLDLGRLRVAFFTSDPDADFDGDGSVNYGDLGAMKAQFFRAPGPSGLAGAPTYTADVQPILFEKCDFCHTGGGYGGHDIGIDYEDAFLPADDYAQCSGLLVGGCALVLVQSGVMPPGGICTGDPEQDAGNEDCLTQYEQDLVQSWLDAGMPE
jgi:hypothetical protein